MTASSCQRQTVDLFDVAHLEMRSCICDDDDLYRDLPGSEGENNVSDSPIKDFAGKFILDTRRIPQRAGEDGYISVTDSQMERIASKSS